MSAPSKGPRRRNRKVVIVAAVACILVAVAAAGGQRNYVGYCAKQGRVLSDPELIRYALQNNSTALGRSGASSVEEFLARNPDCCSVFHESLHFPQNWLEKLVLGRTSTVDILIHVPPEVHAGVRYSRYEVLAETLSCGQPGSAFGDAIADN